MYPLPVVSRSILRQKTLPRGRDVCVSDVGQDGGGPVTIVFDDS